MTNPTEYPSAPCEFPDMSRLNAQVVAQAETDPLIHAVRQSMHGDSIPLFFVGLCDKDQEQASLATQFRRDALTQYGQAKKYVYPDDGLIKKVSERIEIRVSRSNTLANAQQHRSARQMMEHYESERIGVVSSLHSRSSRGLRSSHAFDVMLGAIQYLYFDESPPVWEPDELLVTSFSEKDTIDLFGTNEIPDDLSFESLAVWLRASHPPDLSLETLNARFIAFTDLVSFEFSRSLLEHMRLYSQMSKSATKAVQRIATDNLSTLEGNDLVAKQQLIAHFAQVMKSHAKVTQKTTMSQAMNLMAIGLENMSTNLDEFLQFFTNVYNTLGYELPPILRTEDEPTVNEPIIALGATIVPSVVIAKTKVAQSAPAVDISAETRAIDPELESQLVTQLNTATIELTSLGNRWNLSAKARKAQGLEPLVREMVEGFRNPLGTLLLQPMPKAQATDFVSVLATLNQLTSQHQPEEVYKRVVADTQRRDELQAAIRKTAADYGILPEVTSTQTTEIRTYIQRLANEWPTFRQLILKQWPALTAADVVRRIGEVLALLPSK